ncbi:MAG: glycine/sarcosine/betaine reductase selenoprotein B family protein [Alphaproteobacteria bacterium]|jgi:D-proline reductase (dithiol) PrdB|nr:glycine/sarcosine/betaine reductase selenoprotein B family protein [Alphaproteobacteria bacterium]
MARLDDIAEPMRTHLRDLPCASFDTTPWAEGPPLKERRVALISTAGLQRRDDRPFAVGANDYRVIPADIPAGELIISHISTNFDRTGFQQDWNVMFPLDRLHELAADGEIGSVAAYHYSFMGATDPEAMEPVARQLAGLLRQDEVDAVALVPV